MNQIVEQLSPDHITAISRLDATTGMILIFFVIATITIPIVVAVIARSMKAQSDAFIRALEKRDDDHKDYSRKLNETLERLVVRLTTLELKVDGLGRHDPPEGA